MGIFDFLKGKKNVSQSVASSCGTGLVSKKNSQVSSAQSLPIHPDLLDLLWIGDGPKKNYVQETSSRSSVVDGIRITITLSSQEEPSLLSVNMPVSFDGTSERPTYFPTYKGLTMQQKGEYWRLLSNPYDSSVDIGYVFILYYGLERFLLTDKYEQAIDVVLKLRDIHSNGSFQAYSANAVVLTSILYKRPDILAKFITSLDKEYKFAIDDNVYLLCKYYFELPLTAVDVIRMARSFEFTNTNYIKKYPEVFEERLRDNMSKLYGDRGIVLSDFISKTEFRKLPYSQTNIFANVSIDCRSVVVPHLLTSFKLKKAVNDLLCQTHEGVKGYLTQMRKSGTPVAEKEKPVAEAREVLTFDEKKESELLAEFKKSNKDPMKQHFVSIQLQDLYYKYRNLHPEYLRKCIFYCEDDISKLPMLQAAYKRQEINSIKQLSSIYEKAELNAKLAQVTDFEGQILAFQRLAIIHEKEKDFDAAIAICDSAIAYYDSISMLSLSEAFKQRKAKLEKKKVKS